MLSKIDASKRIKLKAQETWPESYHVFEKRDLLAIEAAIAAERPLLVRGEPGTGKSQLARAAAELLGAEFISKVLDANTEIEDLWFRYDAVRRLGEAQVLAAKLNVGKIDVKKELDIARFVTPQAMWWALDWDSAKRHCAAYNIPELPSENTSIMKTVLLLDEIDKVKSDLANSLLEVLANRAFRVDILNKIVGKRNLPIKCKLVVITSNDERQLPPAFVRRCVVLQLGLPRLEKDFIELLVQRGKQHHSQNGQCIFSDEVLNGAAKQLYEDRERVRKQGSTSLPGQAEYLDMLNVLKTVSEPERLELLEKVSEFIFQKHEVSDS